MKREILVLATALFASGCVTGPTQEQIDNETTFLDRLRKCGEAATISRVNLDYDCKYLGCEADACSIKICNPEQFGDTIKITELEIDQGRCIAKFEAQ